MASSTSRVPSGEYEILCSWLDEDLGSLEEKLSAEDAKKLREFSVQRNLLGAMDSEDAFIAGFAAGARLMAEVFTMDETAGE